MSTPMLAAGILVGAGTLYAYKNDYQVSDILGLININSEKFETFINNLIEVGREFLIKMYNIIKSILMELKFKFKLFESEV